MLEITFSQYELETYLLILVRITSFIYIAPFFGQANTPHRIKLGFALLLSFLVYMVIPEQSYQYATTMEYAVLIVKEAVTGSVIAFSAYLCSVIIVFAGYFIDMEIGFSMATVYDMQTKTQVSVSGQFYQQVFMMMFIVTGMHWYLLNALVDTFTVIPVGGIHVRLTLMQTLLSFMTNYFLIGFRIALPIFAGSLIVNVVLGIMTKVAPQIHMFSIGMQLKILAGLVVMFMIIAAIPNITSFVFTEMQKMMVDVVRDLSL